MLELAGQEAVGDVRRALPGIYPLLVLAALFRPLPPLFRGMAALAIGLLGLLTLLGGLGQLLRR